MVRREKEKEVLDELMVRLLECSKIMLIWFTSLIWIAYDDVVACFIEWEHTEADYHGVMRIKRCDRQCISYFYATIFTLNTFKFRGMYM